MRQLLQGIEHEQAHIFGSGWASSRWSPRFSSRQYYVRVSPERASRRRAPSRRRSATGPSRSSPRDVKLGDQQVAQLMQSEAFEQIMKDPQLRALAADANFQALARSEAFAALAQNAQAFSALASQPARPSRRWRTTRSGFQALALQRRCLPGRGARTPTRSTAHGEPGVGVLGARPARDSLPGARQQRTRRCRPWDSTQAPSWRSPRTPPQCRRSARGCVRRALQDAVASNAQAFQATANNAQAFQAHASNAQAFQALAAADAFDAMAAHPAAFQALAPARRRASRRSPATPQAMQALGQHASRLPGARDRCQGVPGALASAGLLALLGQHARLPGAGPACRRVPGARVQRRGDAGARTQRVGVPGARPARRRVPGARFQRAGDAAPLAQCRAHSRRWRSSQGFDALAANPQPSRRRSPRPPSRRAAVASGCGYQRLADELLRSNSAAPPEAPPAAGDPGGFFFVCYPSRFAREPWGEACMRSRPCVPAAGRSPAVRTRRRRAGREPAGALVRPHEGHVPRVPRPHARLPRAARGAHVHQLPGVAAARLRMGAVRAHHGPAEGLLRLRQRERGRRRRATRSPSTSRRCRHAFETYPGERAHVLADEPRAGPRGDHGHVRRARTGAGAHFFLGQGVSATRATPSRCSTATSRCRASRCRAGTSRAAPSSWRPGWAAASGRAQGGYDEMVFRAMVRDDAHFYDPLGLVSRGTRVDFQVGANAYLYGTRFFTWLAYAYSPEKVVAWLKRDEGSERYYSDQFEQVFGMPARAGLAATGSPSSTNSSARTSPRCASSRSRRTATSCRQRDGLGLAHLLRRVDAASLYGALPLSRHRRARRRAEHARRQRRGASPTSRARCSTR